MQKNQGFDSQDLEHTISWVRRRGDGGFYTVLIFTLLVLLMVMYAESVTVIEKPYLDWYAKVKIECLREGGEVVMDNPHFWAPRPKAYCQVGGLSIPFAYFAPAPASDVGH